MGRKNIGRIRERERERERDMNHERPWYLAPAPPLPANADANMLPLPLAACAAAGETLNESEGRADSTDGKSNAPAARLGASCSDGMAAAAADVVELLRCTLAALLDERIGLGGI